MALSIIEGAPIWVWPVLAFLVWAGLRATRDREVAAWVIYGMPLVGILSVNAAAGLPSAPGHWIVFAGAYLLGAMLGLGYQRTKVMGKHAGRVQLAGEWLTFTVLMVVFWMNFAGGVAEAIAPDVYASASFVRAFLMIAGLSAGSFAGRALGTWRAVPSHRVEA